MTDNPYDSPTRLTGTKRVKSNRKVIARPVGVSILAVFYLLGGVLAFDAQCLMFATFQGIGKSLALFGIPPVVLMIGILCLAGLWAACGAGLWFGTKWGWWLAGFFFVGNTFESGSTVVAIVSIANPLEGGRRFPVGRLIENVVRTVVNLLLLLYLFKGNVLEFFGLATLSKPKAVAILIGICIAIMAAAASIGMVWL